MICKQFRGIAADETIVLRGLSADGTGLRIEQLPVRLLDGMSGTLSNGNGKWGAVADYTNGIRVGFGTARIDQVEFISLEPIHAGSKTEQVVERPIFQHQYDKVFNFSFGHDSPFSFSR